MKVLALVLFLSLASCGAATKCYRCQTAETSRAVSSKTLLERMGYTGLITSICKGEKNDADASDCGGDCFQLIGEIEDAGTVTVRGCVGDTFGSPTGSQSVMTKEACEASDGVSQLGVTMHCSTCSEDLCNSAVSAQISLLLMAVAGIAAKLLL